MRIVLLALTLALVGCKEIKTPDGNLPEDAIEIAEALSGTYKGAFDKRDATVEFSLEGNRPVVSFVDSDNVADVLGVNCNSSIGDLERVRIKEKKGLITAYFKFDDGDCEVLGKTVQFKFGKEGKLRLSILKEYILIYRPDPIPPVWIPLPDVPTRNERNYEQHPVYLEGKFKKQ